ncbi:MAG TPA: polymer-forming cytoskeletal protein [Actinomycetota bacterium]
MRRAATIAAVLPVALLLLAAPTSAQEEHGDDQVVLTGEITIEEGRTVDGVVILNGPATIDGTVRGSVVAFNGEVTISGLVEDDVIVFNGPTTVRSGAEIGGDLITREAAVVEEGATVRGAVRGRPFDLTRGPFPFFARVAVWAALTVSLLVLGLLLVLLFPRAPDAVDLAWRTAMGGAIGLGLLLLIGLPIVGVLIAITIVGVPLGVALLLALALIYAIGYVSAGWVLGRMLIKPPTTALLAALVGILVLRLVALVPALGGIVGTLASAFGLGAIAVAAWRAGRDRPTTEGGAA